MLERWRPRPEAGAPLRGGRIARHVKRTYVAITCLATFANAFIWGINTLFLLDAGLTITQAFLANAFYTIGLVVFEVPTGVVADSVGRRASYLLGCVTLIAATLLYWWLWQVKGAFVFWACASMLIGLGFTFFSGATEAWVVDALYHSGFQDSLESVFARAQVGAGLAMFFGSAAGGWVAQESDLGVPYLIRAAVLVLTLSVSALFMWDLGFTPRTDSSLGDSFRVLLRQSYHYGFRSAPVRWIMLAGPFTMGVGIYAFYALQPYLLELYGSEGSYAVAGAAAALVSGAQALGGLLVPLFRKLFRHRTALMASGTLVSAGTLLIMGIMPTFWVVFAMVAVWATVFAAVGPVRQAYLNRMIPSAQRATVLSSDSLVTAGGGAIFQPGLGRAAQQWGYPFSYVIAASLQLAAIPLLMLARKERAVADRIE